jgi:hypothetical protein
MRAREFITEQAGSLPPETAEPMQHAYIIPGIRNNDAYHTMRLGVAMARARAEEGGYELDDAPFPSTSAVGQNAVVVGFNDNVESVIDRALELTHTPGGKQLIATKTSHEPGLVNNQSPVRAFSGYPR